MGSARSRAEQREANAYLSGDREAAIEATLDDGAVEYQDLRARLFWK